MTLKDVLKWLRKLREKKLFVAENCVKEVYRKVALADASRISRAMDLLSRVKE